MEMSLEVLAKELKYNPTAIGIAILKELGYNVKTFQYSNSIYVYDREDEEEIIYSETY